MGRTKVTMTSHVSGYPVAIAAIRCLKRSLQRMAGRALRNVWISERNARPSDQDSEILGCSSNQSAFHQCPKTESMQHCDLPGLYEPERS